MSIGYGAKITFCTAGQIGESKLKNIWCPAILVFKQMESSGSEIPRKTSDRIVVVHKEEIAKGETSEHIDLAVVEILGRGGSICNWGRDWVGCHFIGIVVDSKRFDDVVLLRIVTKEMLLTYPSLDKSIVASQLV